MRISYSDDEEYSGQFALWEANVKRQINGRKGQATLKELEAALLALPEKRLIRHAVAHKETGNVCAVGALLVLKRAERLGITREEAVQQVAVSEDDWDENDTAQQAAKEGIPKLLAWQLVALNDLEMDWHYVKAEGPTQYPYGYANQGVLLRVEYTPEERYEHVLAWVRRHLKPTAKVLSFPPV